MTACKSNLKNIGTAMDMYAADNSGRFPSALDRLTPIHLKTLPTCPTAGRNTYTLVGDEKAYTVVCSGSNHTGVGYPINQPSFNSTTGLSDR